MITLRNFDYFLRNLISLLFLFLVILFFNHSSIIKELNYNNYFINIINYIKYINIIILEKSIPGKLLWLFININIE